MIINMMIKLNLPILVFAKIVAGIPIVANTMRNIKITHINCVKKPPSKNLGKRIDIKT